jgi:hypothetical protein
MPARGPSGSSKTVSASELGSAAEAAAAAVEAEAEAETAVVAAAPRERVARGVAAAVAATLGALTELALLPTAPVGVDTW